MKRGQERVRNEVMMVRQDAECVADALGIGGATGSGP